MSPTKASERLGHKAETPTLRIYSHALPAHQREAVDRFAALLA